MGRRSGLSFRKRRKKINVSLIREIVSWIVEIAIVIVIAYMVVYFWGFRTSVVGQAMENTLSSGNQVFVNQLVYIISKPKAGDIVVFRPNGNEKSHLYVRRVVAVEGDTILIKNGAVYVNDELYTEQVEVASIEDPGLASDPITLGEDEYFVLGDNRNNSEDSRYASIGNLKKQYIIGKAWFRMGEPGGMGLLD